ncbi:hypothetical protein PanJK_23830 [Pantoea sp. JK]|nr:hypothetical protein [Pantoea sp. JK]MCW6034637.1 hypothetical protein [Pantoea sp. JK]
MINATIDKDQVPTAGLNEYQLNLLKRINNIALGLMPEFVDKPEAMNAVSLDDKTLFQCLYTTMLEQNTRVPDWSDPIPVDIRCPHDEAFSKASGLTPPKWLWRRVRL